jgi:SAM-dependent methyltransferase
MRRKGEGGWFTIPGVQDGERTLEEAVCGLEPLADHAKGATVLDLGCAEGLIGQWFVEHGAAQVDGLDASELCLETARARAHGLPMTFCRADFNEADMPAMDPDYDIVLCLSVLHKLKEPHRLLEYAASKARHWLAVRAPYPAVGTLNILAFAHHRGFELQSDLGGKPWVGLFSRR